MEERKLIRFGKSSLCITLPHAWLRKNKLKKGDSLYIQESLRNSLEIVHRNGSSTDGHELLIDISDRSTDEIIQLLLATYLNGYTTITLKGPNAGKVPFIRKHVQEFIAAEIMEVTSDTIVIHIFWDIKTLNLHSIINRISIITKSIFSETLELIGSGGGADDILEKGVEVQRQVLLARRAIKYALNHSATAHKFNLSSLELLYISYIIYFFGMIDEYILKIAQLIEKTKLSMNNDLSSNKNTQQELVVLLQRSRDYYGKVIDTYNKNRKLVRFVFSEYVDLEESIQKFEETNPQQGTPLLAEYLKMLILKIRETELIMMSMENAPK